MGQGIHAAGRDLMRADNGSQRGMSKRPFNGGQSDEHSAGGESSGTPCRSDSRYSTLNLPVRTLIHPYVPCGASPLLSVLSPRCRRENIIRSRLSPTERHPSRNRLVLEELDE